MIASVFARRVSFACMAAAMALASTAVRADGWIGWMNVFDNAAGSKGGFVFGSGWGVDALKTTVTTSNPGTIVGDQLTLKPNFNTYADNPGDAFWRDNGGAGPNGNKWMEANTYAETNPIAVTSYTLQGTVDANDLDTNLYSAEAFIKVLDPGAGFATILNDRVALPASGPFIVTSDLSLYQGKLLQVGFTMNGLNANPANEVAFGSVAVTVVPEPSALGFAAVGIAGLARLWRRSRR